MVKKSKDDKSTASRKGTTVKTTVVKKQKKPPLQDPEITQEVELEAESEVEPTKKGLKKVIEGALFASEKPLCAQALAKLFVQEEKLTLGQIRQMLLELQSDYSDRGITLIEVASGYRFQVANEVAPYIAKSLEEKPARYSRALLETLALIAYRQPITRSEVEDIRGVVVSTQIMKTLHELEWIRIVGYKEVPGKPALYATTKSFLDHFGLKNLEDLPPLAELKDLNSLVVQEPRAQELEMAEENLENETVALE